MPESPNKLLNNDHGNYVFATFTGHMLYDYSHNMWLFCDIPAGAQASAWPIQWWKWQKRTR